jgi:basic membrane protein A
VTDGFAVSIHSFNKLAQLGAQSVDAKTRVIQTSAGGDFQANLQKCAGDKPDLTIAISAATGNAVWHVAQQHRDLRFAIVDGQPLDDTGQVSELANVADILFKEEEPAYLAGYLAGLLEKEKVGAASHNIIGILGGNHSPRVDAYVGGYVAGAKAANATVGIKLSYTDSEDPAFCKQVGIDQVRSGADILFEVVGRCDTGYIDAAYDASSYAIGSETDKSDLSPAVITSAVNKVDRVVATVLRRMKAGQFKSGQNIFTLADDATGFTTPASVVPQDVINQVLDQKVKIQTGRVTPPSTAP